MAVGPSVDSRETRPGCQPVHVGRDDRHTKGKAEVLVRSQTASDQQGLHLSRIAYRNTTVWHGTRERRSVVMPWDVGKQFVTYGDRGVSRLQHTGGQAEAVVEPAAARAAAPHGWRRRSGW